MRVSLAIGITLAATCIGQADEVIKCEFGDDALSPFVRLTGDASVVDGALRSSPLPGWVRSGVVVGPLPMRDSTWTISYDVRPVASGAQCQEFVSVTPTTHWYMVYRRPDGRVILHTRADDAWEARDSSPAPLELDTWHSVIVDLDATSIRYRVRERGAAGDLWDTGRVAMDDVGEDTVFGLIDESLEAVGATEWDNLIVSTDSPDVVAAMRSMAADLAEEQRLEANRQAVAADVGRAGFQADVLGKARLQARSRLVVDLLAEHDESDRTG